MSHQACGPLCPEHGDPRDTSVDKGRLADSAGVFLDQSAARLVLDALKREARKAKDGSTTCALTPHLSRWPHLHETPFAYALLLQVTYSKPGRKDQSDLRRGHSYYLRGDAVGTVPLDEDGALLVLRGVMPKRERRTSSVFTTKEHAAIMIKEHAAIMIKEHDWTSADRGPLRQMRPMIIRLTQSR